MSKKMHISVQIYTKIRRTETVQDKTLHFACCSCRGQRGRCQEVTAVDRVVQYLFGTPVQRDKLSRAGWMERDLNQSGAFHSSLQYAPEFFELSLLLIPRQNILKYDFH